MKVKEIFPTIQGEGSKCGLPCIFVRLSGCNLWSGKESGREKGIGDCSLWCDTDFYGGEKFTAVELFEKLESLTKDWKSKSIVITGGEPTLQLKKKEGLDLINMLFSKNWNVCIETNGTVGLNQCEALDLIYKHPNGHITVSPKPLKKELSSTTHVNLKCGTDLKVVVPTYFDLRELAEWNFENIYLQPMDIQDGSKGITSLQKTLELSRKYGYSVSIQIQKFIGVP